MLDAQLVDRIGWTLIHSIWQIILVAYVVAVCNRLVFRMSAGGRYVVGCAALSAMLLLPVTTFVVLPPSSDAAVAQNDPTLLSPESSKSIIRPSRTAVDPDDAIVANSAQPDSDVLAAHILAQSVEEEKWQENESRREKSTTPLSAIGPWRDRLTAWLQPAMSSIVIVWFVGMLLLSARPIFGLYTIRRLRCVGRSQVPEQINTIVRQLCSKMGIKKTIEVAESALLEVPAVVGSLRPLLLLPATAVTGLMPQELEAVVAHELAHVRRHDYLVNVLQTIVETVLFYHPAVWWVSAAVRRERENCCDDIAVVVCNDRATYAKTLVMLDELRAALPQPAVAANGGSLLQRIRRLAGSDQPQHSSTTWLAGAFLFVALMVAAASVVTVTPEAIADEDEDAGKPNVRLRLQDSDGKRLDKKMYWQSAYRGWRKSMPSKSYPSDERGRLDMNLDPGKHAIVFGYRHQATVLEFDVPATGLKGKRQLPAKPAPIQSANGYPDLNARAEVRAGKHLGEEFVVMTISNNKDEPYTLRPTDFTFTTTDVRVYPPKSQQQTGVVIPPKDEGEKVITLAWHEYVRDGIWTSRSEPISEPWPATVPKPGKLWFRPNVGITGPLPIQVTMPAVILDPQSIDPRTLKEYTGGLRGQFVLQGDRPRPKRFQLPFRRTLDGQKLKLLDDQVLKADEVFDESIVIGEAGGVANIVVWVRSKDIPIPLVDDPHVSMNVKNGRIDPHITFVQPGQHLSITNNEKFGVNFHAQAFRNKSVNVLLGPNHGTSHQFNSAEPRPLHVQCNIHPWYSGWIVLRDNPFMTVSGEDGTFEIKGISPGEWEFQFWHEKGGYLRRETWPKGRVTIKIDDETHDLGTIKLTKEELGVEPPDADPSEPPPAAEAKSFSGMLRGRFVFDGQPPKRAVIKPNKDPAVVKGVTLYDQSLVVGEDRGIANVFIWLRDADVPVPPINEAFSPVMLANKYLQFKPHALALRTGQKLIVKNDDPVAVSTNIQTLTNRASLMVLPVRGQREYQFDKGEPLPIPVTDNIHPWMKAFMIVRDNPYFAVTKEDGSFEINNLPPGEWEFQLWHEKAGYLKRDKWPKGRVKINIKSGNVDFGTVKLDHEEFDLPKPAGAQQVGDAPAFRSPGFYAQQDGGSRLLAAITGGDHERVARILEQTPKAANVLDRGFTPLHIAAQKGRTEAAKLLLKAGASVTAKQTTFHGTPLQYAAATGHIEMCKLLLSNDAAVDATDTFGRTPLMWAAMQGHAYVVAFLIEHGADVNAQTTTGAPGSKSGKGATALHLAVEKKHDETVALLLARGCDRNLRNAAGRTPFETSSDPTERPVESAVEDTWYRDAPYPEIGFFQADEIDRSYVRIMTHMPALRELGMSNTQLAVLTQLGAWASQDFHDVKGNDREGRQAVWAKARKRAEALLTEQQRRRVKQLFIQQRRHEVFMNPKILPQLKITDEQLVKIRDKWQQHLKRIPNKGVRSAENARKGNLSYRRFWAEVREILMVQQRKTFEQLRGPPATKAPSGGGVGGSKSADKPSNPGDEPSSEKIGKVFGEPIYRHQLATEEKDDQALNRQLVKLIMGPVMTRYREEHADEIKPTDEEIADGVKFFADSATNSSGEEAKRLNNLANRDTVAFLLDNLKFQRHLYDKFGGGRVLFQQFGLEAFDATHNWMLKHEQAGDFKVNDPELRAKLFHYWTRDHGGFLSGEKGKSDPDALTLRGIYTHGGVQE